MKRTPLYDRHVALGARMVEFGGWEMPIQYPTGIVEEHLRTRRHAGLFDVSHMGRFVFRGPGALPLLQKVLTNNAAALKPGRAQYTVIPTPTGGALDDAYLYCLDREDYLLVVNASNREKDWDFLHGQARGIAGLEMKDRSEELAMLSLQGPESRRILLALIAEAAPSRQSLPEEMHPRARPQQPLPGGHRRRLAHHRPHRLHRRPPGLRVLPSLRRSRAILGPPARPGCLADRAGGPRHAAAGGGAPPVRPRAGHGSRGPGDTHLRLAPGPVRGQLQRAEREFHRPRPAGAAVRGVPEHPDGTTGTGSCRRAAPPRATRQPARPGNRPPGSGDLRRRLRIGGRVGWITSGTMAPYWVFTGEGVSSSPSERTDKRAIGIALLDSSVALRQMVEIDVRGRRIRGLVVPYLLRSEAAPYARPILWGESGIRQRSACGRRERPRIHGGRRPEARRAHGSLPRQGRGAAPPRHRQPPLAPGAVHQPDPVRDDPFTRGPPALRLGPRVPLRRAPEGQGPAGRRGLLLPGHRVHRRGRAPAGPGAQELPGLPAGRNPAHQRPDGQHDGVQRAGRLPEPGRPPRGAAAPALRPEQPHHQGRAPERPAHGGAARFRGPGPRHRISRGHRAARAAGQPLPARRVPGARDPRAVPSRSS